MRERFFAVVAWALWALTAATLVAGIVLLALGHSLVIDSAALAIAFNAFPFVGAIIVARRHGNPVGWICLAIGLGTAYTFLDAAYAAYCTMVFGQPTTISVWIDWVGNCVWPLNLSLAAALMLLFPTGSPVTPRWRWLVWAMVVDTVLTVGTYAILPGTFSGETTINPAGIRAFADVVVPLNSAAQIAQGLILLLAATTAVWRFWRSRGVEREQMKWFAYGVATLIVCAIVSTQISSNGSNVLFAVGIITLPIGIGVAVLRFRLYDIDVIIRRTLIYGTLTAILAGVYFSLVITAQILGERLTGQSQPPPWLIVMTTLIIAALFMPLRRRIQQLIDLHFYRRRYDATRTVEAFAATLRSEVDLYELHEHLVGVVDQTMQPEHVSLWIRSPSETDASRA